MEEFSQLREAFVQEAEMFSFLSPLYSQKSEFELENPLKDPLNLLEPESEEAILAKLNIRETVLKQYLNNTKFRKINPVEDVRLELNNKFLKGFLNRFNRKLKNANIWYLECLDGGESKSECEKIFQKI